MTRRSWTGPNPFNVTVGNIDPLEVTSDPELRRHCVATLLARNVPIRAPNPRKF
jgi:hypothetical protein